MGNSRARTKHLQELWAQQEASRRAPHFYKSNSKHQPANEKLQLQPVAAEQPQPQPLEVPVEQQPAVAAEAANAVQQQEDDIIAEQQQQQQLEVLRDALSIEKQQIKDLSAQVAAATVQWHAQVAGLQRQLARMAAAEEVAAAKMDALEADMAHTEEKLAHTVEKSHTYGSLLANGMMDKVLWLIDHPCGLKQLRKLSGFNYFRYVARSLPCLGILALMTALLCPCRQYCSSFALKFVHLQPLNSHKSHL